MSFFWLATHSQILIFSNIILHNFIVVSKVVSSFFKVFIFLRIRCVKLEMCEWICVNIRYIKWRSVKFRKLAQRLVGLIVVKGIFSGLYSVQLIFERLNFQMWRLRKGLGKRVGSYYSYKLRLLYELKDTNLSYLSNVKKIKKSLHYSLH